MFIVSTSRGVVVHRSSCIPQVREAVHFATQIALSPATGERLLKEVSRTSIVIASIGDCPQPEIDVILDEVK